MMQVPDWYEGDVSRETLEKLGAFADLLRKWTQKINLIARSTVDDLEERHIWDSAQVYDPTVQTWADFGSGGGLPGIVTAILADGAGQTDTTTLVESDQRKSVFLRTCARELSLPVKVLSARIEDVKPLGVEAVSARALADLDRLIGLAKPHLASGGRCIFMKGASWRTEIDQAQQNWHFSYDARPSKTNPEAVILHLKEIERV